MPQAVTQTATESPTFPNLPPELQPTEAELSETMPESGIRSAEQVAAEADQAEAETAGDDGTAPEDNGEGEEVTDEQPQRRLSYEDLEQRYRAADTERSNLRRQTREAIQTQQQMEQAFQQVLARVQQMQPQPQPQVPGLPPGEKLITDPTEDPIRYVQQQNALLQAQQAQIAQVVQGQIVADQQRRIVENLVNTAQASEAEFAERAPDYPVALNHYRTAQQRYLEHRFPDASPQQVADTVRNEELKLISEAVQAGRSPAEYLYGIAANVLGYSPQALQQAQEQRQQQTQRATAQQFQRTKEGIHASRTIGNIASSEPPESGGLLRRLSRAKGPEFDELWKQAADKGLL